ncbi:Kynurenine 3-monooxygenase [Smittium mucronatum]|uniref:Kynurenine 3-monooxygenase n=1 Tax=Smittium mucronatum TaxID=133383 RepID=A0A1R0H9E8_9FUNG|nr:Kynurenine 3-monooxygenase [Smittium mucronatum]
MKQNKVIIVGGGLVGSLAACYFAKRGWVVELYEKRPDPRDPENLGTRNLRSINLAISTRGLSAINRLSPEVEKKVMDIVLPMYGRMIHNLDGSTAGQAYNVFGKAINSVDRGRLNEILLDECETFEGTKVFFEYSLEKCDMDAKTATFKNLKTGEIVSTSGDLVIGADGVHSVTRRFLQYYTKVNFEQVYIDHGYMEFEMRAKDGQFQMAKDHLHIWPRKTFMLIALPNLDKSFTCTLFMPWSKFNSIKTEEDLNTFFKENFPDSIPLFGQEEINLYFTNPKGSLCYIKCSPHHYKGNAVIVGDASHCTVPFYAQGMNCGFEDIEVLDTLLCQQAAPLINSKDAEQCQNVKTSSLTSDQIESALINYSACRPRDSASMIDLAMHNYIEMRHSVNTLSYKMRQWLEGKLYSIMPNTVIPLYTMVSFSKISYTDATKKWNRQTKALQSMVSVFSKLSFITAATLLIRYSGPRMGLRMPSISEIVKIFRK